MRRDAQRLEDVRQQGLDLRDEGVDQAGIGRGIAAQTTRRRRDGSLENRHIAVGQRVGQRQARMHPLDAEPLQLDGSKEGRRDGERMNGRTDVMLEARTRQLLGAGAAAQLLRGLHHEYRSPGPRQLDRRRETVRPRTDHDGIEHHAREHAP